MAQEQPDLIDQLFVHWGTPDDLGQVLQRMLFNPYAYIFRGGRYICSLALAPTWRNFLALFVAEGEAHARGIVPDSRGCAVRRSLCVGVALSHAETTGFYPVRTDGLKTADSF